MLPAPLLDGVFCCACCGAGGALAAKYLSERACVEKKKDTVSQQTRIVHRLQLGKRMPGPTLVLSSGCPNGASGSYGSSGDGGGGSLGVEGTSAGDIWNTLKVLASRCSWTRFWALSGSRVPPVFVKLRYRSSPRIPRSASKTEKLALLLCFMLKGAPLVVTTYQ